MTRITITTIIFLIFNSFIFSQERPNYELLWEITKNNNPEKSYLFGTMHVKEERAFQFPDALFPAIKNTAVFALEIHPEEATDEMVHSLIKSDTINRFKKALSKDEYKLLKERFFTINQVDLDSIPMQHPFLITAMLDKEINKPTDRRTFLDAYLYSIAHHYDKEITGLEDLKTQFPSPEIITDAEIRESVLYYINNEQEKQDEYLEKLYGMYYEGDLKKIQEFVNEFDGIDHVMISRNNVIAKSMDSIIKQKTLFSAIGAAHLRGKDGVIALLENKGYTLKPVPATFLNSNKKFDLTPKIEQWILNDYPELGYSIKTPSTGSLISLGADNTLFSVLDILSGNEFTYFGYDTNKREYPEGYDIVEEMLKNQFSKDKTTIISKNVTKENDFEITEVVAKKDNKSSRLRIYYNGRFIYMFHVQGALNEMNTAYVNAFFNSIKMYEPEGAETKWSNHLNELGAYSVDMPGEIEDISRITNSPDDESIKYDLKLLKSIDINNKVLCLMRYNNQPYGYYLQNESLSEDQFKDYFNNLGWVTDDPERVKLGGFDTLIYRLFINDKYNAIARITFRGNRTYMQLAQSLIPGAKIDLDYPFYNSFKFEPIIEGTLLEPVIIDEKYEIRFFGDYKKSDSIKYDFDQEFVSTINYQNVDQTAGGSYIFQQSRFKQYAKSSSKQQYLDDYSKQILEYNDSIIHEKNFTIDGALAKKINIFNSSTSVNQELTIVLNGEEIVTLLAYVGQEEKDRIKQYTDSFKIIGEKEKFDISESKSKQIFKNLKSKDSITFYEAEGAFDYYVFEPEDNKLLLKNLNTKYLDDDIYYGAKYHVIDEIATLDQTTSLQKLLKYYNTQRDNNLKIHTLKNLGAFTSTEAKDIFIAVINNNPPKRDEENSFDIFEKIQDKANFMAENEEVLTTLIENEKYRDKLVNMYKNYILEDSIYSNKIPQFTRKLKSFYLTDAQIYADSSLRKKHINIDYSIINDYRYIIKSDSLRDKNAEKALLTIAAGNTLNDWTQIATLIDAINLEIEIPDTLLRKHLESLYSRYEIIEALVKNNKTTSIPEEYLTTQSFSKLSLYNSIGYNYDTYTELLNYLGELTHNGEQYHIFNYGFKESPEELFLGFSKVHTIDLENMESFETKVTYDSIEKDWESQVITILNKE